MRKIILWFMFFACFSAAVLAAAADTDEAFERAANLYLGGNTEKAFLIIEDALKKEPDNPRYEAFYAVLSEERERLIVIDKRRKEGLAETSPISGGVKAETGFAGYYTLLGEISGRVDRMRDEAAAKTGALEARVEAAEKKAEENSGQARGLADRIERESSAAVMILAAILFFILLILFVNIYFLRGLKRAEAAVKYLTLRQDETAGRVGRIEENVDGDKTGD